MGKKYDVKIVLEEEEENDYGWIIGIVIVGLIWGGLYYIDSIKKNSVTNTETFGSVARIPYLSVNDVSWSPSSVPNDLDMAISDCNWKQDLVNEQSQRIDMIGAAKTGVFMKQKEFEAYLQALRSSTVEYIRRSRDADYCNRNLITLLNRYPTKYSNTEQLKRTGYNNLEITSSDLKITIDNYNGDVGIYNKGFAK